MTVVYFGPLTCSIITTTRKFFTILASVILFANPISPMQWVGTVLVFLGESGKQILHLKMPCSEGRARKPVRDPSRTGATLQSVSVPPQRRKGERDF